MQPPSLALTYRHLNLAKRRRRRSWWFGISRSSKFLECTHCLQVQWIDYLRTRRFAHHIGAMAAAAAVSESQLWLVEHESKARDSCEVVEDCDHLQGLDPTFACTADAILCADDGNTSLIGLPIHSDLISTYSPALSFWRPNVATGSSTSSRCTCTC